MKLLPPCDGWASRSALALADSGPEAVVAGRPASLCSALFQRRRPCQCSRLLREHIEVVLQIKHMLEAVMAALMPRCGAAPVPDFDVGRIDLGLDRCPDRHRR